MSVLALTTGDPRFDPQEPVTINGYRYVPAPEEAEITEDDIPY
jgi:hypothetical protein